MELRSRGRGSKQMELPDNAFRRALRKSIAYQRAESQREAEALGFPSWEAKERHAMEQSRKRLD